ncbi:hypothetical protein [Pseudomonas sp. BF-B-30]|uniref:hypothetical protein n=1 Tax=Pseudomonas sp. BF-B-30 TaxID=2832388 RepID=UPI001CC0584B|nr:hypothetical protein [Pseudomonas sp. BF-B-30]
MSKLSKYRTAIRPSEAAQMLSRLIDEEVAEEEILELFNSGWIIGHYQCDASIIRLKLMLEPDLHEEQIAIGDYFVESTDHTVGTCLGIHYPSFEVLLYGRLRILALKDNEGSIYGIKDKSTGMFLGSSEEDGLLEDVMLDTESILEFARHANNDEAPPELRPHYECIRRNEYCFSDRDLYPFHGNNSEQRMAQTKIMPAVERPSLQLIIASLLDIVKDPKRAGHNQTSIISEIVERNPGVRGLSESSLSKAFALAKQIADDARPAA